MSKRRSRTTARRPTFPTRIPASRILASIRNILLALGRSRPAAAPSQLTSFHTITSLRSAQFNPHAPLSSSTRLLTPLSTASLRARTFCTNPPRPSSSLPRRFLAHSEPALHGHVSASPAPLSLPLLLLPLPHLPTTIQPRRVRLPPLPPRPCLSAPKIFLRLHPSLTPSAAPSVPLKFPRQSPTTGTLSLVSRR